MAAARAATPGRVRPLLVQPGPIGGDCTFTGCVPSKTMIETAAWGGTFDEAKAATGRAIATITARENDEVLLGWARFRAPDEVDVDGTVFRSGRVVIATDAAPAARRATVSPTSTSRLAPHLPNPERPSTSSARSKAGAGGGRSPRSTASRSHTALVNVRCFTAAG